MHDSWEHMAEAGVFLMQVHEQHSYLPWLAVLMSWICFGSFAVPMKSSAVIEAKVHPVIYQLYKTCWNCAASFLVLLFFPFEFTWWGLASGFCWVPAGIAAVVAVQNIGMACGQAIWQMTIIFSSFVWGFVILQDTQVRSLAGTLLSLGMLALGVLGMTWAFSLSTGEQAKGLLQPLLRNRRGDPEGRPHVPAAGCKDASKHEKQGPKLSYEVGICAALFNGLVGGANLVPSHFSSIQGVHFVLSFGIGALLANGLLLAAFGGWRCLRGEPLPSLEFRVMLVPGLVSGLLWAVGNFCALYAVATLGQCIGYSLVQASIIVSGLWGIVYYRELSGVAILYWATACMVCFFGVVGLAGERMP